jgi:hypothetical protein
MHLRVAVERLRDRFGVKVHTHPPRVGYRETIRKPITQRGRHKKQSGGHGQFGDVVLDIKPLPRGSGFQFSDTIKGGVVPQQYVPSVEAGVRSYLKCGPLGFPVVDVAVTLTDGSYHSVDSSDMAFQMAGRLAMSEALPQCQPVLLEPIFEVEITCPNEDQRDPVAAARTDSRLRGTRRLGRLGRGARDPAGVGNRRSDRRSAFGDRRRGRAYLALRSSRGTDRQAGRPDRGVETRGGVTQSVMSAVSSRL